MVFRMVSHISLAASFVQPVKSKTMSGLDWLDELQLS